VSPLADALVLVLVWGLQVYKDWVGRATYSFLPPAAALSELQLPAQLSAFKLWQEKARGAMKSKLISEWVPTVVNIMMDNLDSTFDFYCHSMDKVDGSDLQRFLLYLRLFMTDGIRSLALNSVADWITFMELFSDTGGNGGAPAPLLQVDLQLVDGPDGPTYMFEPPLQVCVDTILSMFDKSVEGMGGVPCADHLLMPLADVGESSLLHVTLNDATVAAARRRLETILEESLAGPRALAARFESYLALASIDEGEYAETWGEGHHMDAEDRRIEAEELARQEAELAGPASPRKRKNEQQEEEEEDDDDEEQAPPELEGPPNLQQIQAEISSKREAYQQVVRECSDDVVFPMFVVRTAETKKQIASVCESLVKVVLDSLSRGMRRTNAETFSGFDEMVQMASSIPTDVEELASLKTYIDDAENQMQGLVERINSMVERLTVFDEFQYVQTDEDFAAACQTRMRPEAVKTKLQEASFRLEETKHKMLEDFMGERDRFEGEISRISVDAEAFSRYGELDKLDEISEKLNSLNDRLEAVTVEQQKINSREVLFDFPPTEYPEIGQVQVDFQPYAQLWGMAVEFMKSEPEWMHGSFLTLDPEKIGDTVRNTSIQSFKLKKKFKDQKEPIDICEQLKEKVDAFAEHLPIITALRTPGLKDRHWKQISEEIAAAEAEAESPTRIGELSADPAMTLGRLLEQGTAAYLEQINKVAEIASKEWGLEDALHEMEKAWESIEFVCMPYRDTGTYVLSALDDNMQLLDDQVVKTQTMLGSPFIAYLKKPTEEWEKKLKTMTDVLDEWLSLQKNWLYLEPIFGSEDIMRQMPVEGKKFQAVDAFYRRMMKDAVELKLIVTVTTVDNLANQFLKFNTELELILKGLNQYLEVKRLAFPRFFFLSNDELLEILSQTKDPKAVQPHLGKCFENIVTLEFEQNLDIVAMYSGEKERVDFLKKIVPTSQVEAWLLEVEGQMRESLADMAIRCIDAYRTAESREAWILNWPGQMVLCGSQLYWTIEVEGALRNGGTKGLREYVKQMNKQLDNVTSLARDPNLTKMHRMTIGALVTMDVHSRDVTQDMADAGVSELTDFDWISQLRYYQEENEGRVLGVTAPKTLTCKMISSALPYYYEYLGNTFRLVVTPLTDRCYRTLMGALQLNLGGAPEGPAGTGKTETTKDLAKALAKQCVVFNCSDSMDFRQMAKFFKGLASSGAWACFDEFNRINLEVLSVIAQQLITIKIAREQKLKRFTFEGTEIGLDPSNAAFITMNPGYAGRSALPDNLKALFRTVAMMVPNYALIAEISLMSCGYKDARNLARKITSTFKLSSEQLSSQKHYDFGMRAVKSVLTAGARLKQLDPDQQEDTIVLRSIRDCNVPKFLTQDLPLFAAITSDLFPGVKLPSPDYATMMDRLKFHATEAGLIPTESMLENCSQLYETIMVRHGLMLVGEPYAGKTNCYQMLAKAMGDMESNEVQYHVINPKAVKMSQLYGAFDDVSHEWSDGVLAITVRKCAMDPSPNRKWVVFDGPVDAIWIENMNTVLDDNKKLCLNSGEIIKLSSVMTMMFEVADLLVASPATVSRCGMVFMEPETMGWRPVLQAYLDNKLPASLAESKEQIIGLSEWLVDPITKYMYKHCKELVTTTNIMVLHSLTRMFDAHLDAYQPDSESSPPDGKKRTEGIEGTFLFAMIWSLCATVDELGRADLDIFVRNLLAGEKENEDDEDLRRALIPIPDGGSIYDYQFDTRAGKWIKWEVNVPDLKIADGTPFHQITVPTVDTYRNSYWSEIMITHQYHLLLTGPTGTGKTMCIKDKLINDLPKESWAPILLSFSAATSENQTQNIIDSKLDKRRKGVFGPAFGKRAVVFVDDLNMPAKEFYGAQPPIELLRQSMDHGGWYDLGDKTFRSIVDVQYVAAMGPPGGGRTFITNRYTRHFSLIALTNYSQDSLTRVFGTILNYFLKPFSRDIVGVAANVVTALLELYDEAGKVLLPTPKKSHYQFNLRDLSKCVSGIMQVKPANVESANAFIKLWYHECARVFHDRLTDDEDRFWFKKYMSESVSRNFKKNWVEVADQPFLFGTLLDLSASDPAYKEITDMAALKSVMQEQLADYNVTSDKPMDLVLFQFALDHVARIARVLRQPFGNCMLVGVGGSGRQSVSKLAAHTSDMEVVQIVLSKKYGMTEWREDMKALLRKGGCEGEPTCFLIADTEIVNEAFLEDLNNILNTGEVPNIFDAGEIAEVLDEVRKAAQTSGANLPDSTNNTLFNYFIERCRQNIHIVLAMSPIGDAFATRLRMYPSLVNCCTIDWFSAWPAEALRSVAEHFLHDVDMEPDTMEKCTDMFAHMHESVSGLADRFLAELRRNYYVTPTSYLELINTFTVLLAERRAEVLKGQRRYEVGLDKLNSTAAQVAEMETELVALQPVLETKTVEVNELMAKIKVDTIDADKMKAVVSVEAAAAQEQQAAADKLKESCEADLAEAMPALEAAVGALNTLNKNDITVVKSMKKPPDGVVLVMKGLIILMEVTPMKKEDPDKPGKKVADYWETAKKEFLGDPKFLQRLYDFDKDAISDEVIEKLQPVITDPGFAPELVKKASEAAKGLSLWVGAMVKYQRVSKIVGPKKAQLEAATKELNEVSAALKVKEDELQAVVDKLQALEDGLKAAVDEKQNLDDQVADCKAKLIRAKKLMDGLGGEKIRWSETAERLKNDYGNIVGDVLVSSGSIAYLGAFTMLYRKSCMEAWMAKLKEEEVPGSEDCSLVKVLGQPVLMRQWMIYGLPSDNFSMENAIMAKKSNRWPLMIDPQGSANKFVKNMEADSGLLLIKLSDANFVRTLENAIQFGNPVLLENIGETIDPVLDTVLQKQTFKQGGRTVIKVGDNVVEYSPDFRFYITTKLRNPHYSPEISVKVTLLNFMATPAGLQDQMLGTVVAMERPDLEAEKAELIVENAAMKKQLQEIEDQILELLSNAEGNILDDENLINVLATAKVTSNEVEEKVAKAAVVEEKIDTARSKYIPVAYRASILFFCISDLCGIDPMYQYSLPWFTNLFVAAIENCTAEKANLEERLPALNEDFTYSLYKNVCRSLFEQHKLLFSFLLCIRIMSGDDKIDMGLFRFFLTGALTISEGGPPNPAPEWLTDKSWNDLHNLEQQAGYEGITSDFATNVSAWAEYYESKSPHHAPLPGKWDEKLDRFGKMVVLRCLRPDVVVPAAREFVENEMAKRYVEPPPFDLAACFADSNCTTPLVFVLSPGSDPLESLMTLAKDMNYTDKLQSTSLGQGQGPIASAMIEAAVASGGWVLLSNCHLASSWMPSLEQICEGFTPEKTSPNFRLWLTSMPSPAFPVSVLQNGVKMTNEPPKGLKANLRNTYLSIDNGWFEDSNKPTIFKKLLFGLTFFHAIIQERRKFGPLGWNIPYEFNDTDYRISMRQLQMFLNDYDETQWEAIKYLAGQCNYGGRVTDDHDRTTLTTLLQDYFAPEILDDAYRFKGTDEYYAPGEGDLQSYIDHCYSLPVHDDPQVFGLHRNAEITFALNETGQLLSTVLSLQPATAAGGAKSPEEIADELAADMLAKVPEAFDVEAAAEKYPVLYEESMNTVFVQELVRFNGLINTLRSSLVQLRKAMKGLVVMSADLEQVFKSLTDGKVPALWAGVAYPSLKPLGSWVVDLIARLKFLQTWLDEGPPACYWISGFFFTQSFLTGTLQNFARRQLIPIDMLTFDFQLMTDVHPTTPADDGCYIHGLFIEGCRWDASNTTLAESEPKVLFSAMPVIWLKVAESSTLSRETGFYQSPVYRTAERRGTLSTTGHSTNFVMEMFLPTTLPANHWVKRGVALLCALSD
jgi:dynein heavy chain